MDRCVAQASLAVPGLRAAAGSLRVLPVAAQAGLLYRGSQAQPHPDIQGVRRPVHLLPPAVACLVELVRLGSPVPWVLGDPCPSPAVRAPPWQD